MAPTQKLHLNRPVEYAPFRTHKGLQASQQTEKLRCTVSMRFLEHVRTRFHVATFLTCMLVLSAVLVRATQNLHPEERIKRMRAMIFSVKHGTHDIYLPCLRGKRMYAFGDSTLTDFAHDLIILLSGRADDAWFVDEYARNATRQSLPHSQIVVPSTYDSVGSIVVDFYGNHRNMSVTVPLLDMVVHHRFMGHWELQNDHGGVQTFFKPSVLSEFPCAWGMNEQCMHNQTILIVNSGLHDIHYSLGVFNTLTRDLASRFENIQSKGATVVWKGNSHIPHASCRHASCCLGSTQDQTESSVEACQDLVKVQEFDSIARAHMHAANVAFVDVAPVLDSVRDSVSLFSPDRVHYGAIAKYHDDKVDVSVSLVVANRILDQACSLA